MATSKDIKHKAIDASGHLGSLYDNRRHRILVGHYKTVGGQSMRSSQSSYCEITNGSTNTDFNLLKLVRIDNELRLYLLLKSTNRVGVASALNYNRRIDEHTRILYYSHIDRKEQVKDMADVSKMLKSSDHQRFATHVITGIDLGIDLVVILQLPPRSDRTVVIDLILEKIRTILLSNHSTASMLTDEEDRFLEENVDIAYYSNTPNLTNLYRMSAVLHRVNRMKKEFSFCQPITYYLSPTTQFHPQYNARMTPIPSTLIEEIEEYLLPLRAQIAYLETSCKDYTPLSIWGTRLNHFYKCRGQLYSLKGAYIIMVEQFFDKIIALRDGRLDTSAVRSILHNDGFVTLKTTINRLTHFLCNLLGQKPPIMPLRQQSFNYHNPGEEHPHEINSTKITDVTRETDDRHGKKYQTDVALINNDDLKQKESNQGLVDRRKNNCTSSSTSVSRLYPILPVQNIKSPLESTQYHENQSILPTFSPANVTEAPALPESPSQIPVPYELPSQTHVPSELSPKTSVPSEPPLRTFFPSEISPQTPFLPEISPPPTDSIINILLLGESGVGKSTFINAFVNYLSFDTFEQAELNQPVVLIPVSFLMTVGDNFEERTVKFGAIDDSKNEDFDHPGQSVTQHCKSYIFHLKDEKKLCIIDTPGFGDTRGIDRDDRNMQNILEYINNLDHLNAVCFLLKPNASRLNVFFRSCITQILDLLGPTICRNLAFCFTNARTTFYTPGDTAPLLKQMLQSLSIKDIPFGKENTFCFDNESFRYLVALRNEIPFTQEDQQEYAKSWSVAVKESNRLIDYILIKLSLYPKQGDWQSNKHAQLEINYMIRPILETMRNILRNIILQIKGVLNRTIELNPVVLHRSASLCLSCKSEKMQIENFFIIKDCPHEFQNTCRLNCPCLPEQHTKIDYMLKYKVVDTSPNHLRNNTTDKLDELCKASATFAHFLVSITHPTREDPFEHGLTRMINQENDLCHKRDSNDLNWQLSIKLQELQTKYLQTIDKIKSNPERSSLSRIYQLMEAICKHPMVEIQMDAVRQGREIIMKQHENEHQEI